MAERTHRERAAFFSWLQDPDRVLYEESLSKSWKNFLDKRKALNDDRGRLAQFIFGEPRKFCQSIRELCLVFGLHLYNRWKSGAEDNLSALIAYLENSDSKKFFLLSTDIKDVKGLLKALSKANDPWRRKLKQYFSFEGKKLFDLAYVEEKSEAALKQLLVLELNIIEGPSLYIPDLFSEIGLSRAIEKLGEDSSHSNLKVNRNLEETLWAHIQNHDVLSEKELSQDADVVEIISDGDIRHLYKNVQNLILFDRVYENMISDLVSMAKRQTNQEEFQRLL